MTIERILGTDTGKQAFDKCNTNFDTNKTDILSLQTQNGSEVLTTNAQTLSGAINETKTQTNSLEAKNNDLLKYARFLISANQSIPNSTNTQIIWSTKTSYNSEDFCEIDAATGKIKILKAGVYMIQTTIAFAGNATGVRTYYGNVLDSTFPNNSSTCYITTVEFINAVANQLLDSRAVQTSGGAIDLLGTTNTYAYVRKVG